MGERILAWLENFAPHLIAALCILLAGHILSKITIKIMAKGLDNKHIDNTAHTFVMSVVKTLITVFSIIIALSALNVPMSSIVATVGAAGLAIGLALQNSLSNVSGGFIILFSQPFRCGDYVEIGGVSGKVNSISILYTRLLTIDNKAVYIPNGQITNATIINYTDEEFRRLDLEFSISYESDYDTAVGILRDILTVSEFSLDTPKKPFVAMSGHADSAIMIITKTWVKADDYWSLNYEVLEKVKKSFDENGISIPYNHLDVNITET